MNNHQPTPASFAFSQEISPRVIAENKQIIRQILERESNIYELVFKCFAFAAEVGSRADAMFNFFCDQLHQQMIVNASAEQIRQLAQPIHNAYWSLAKKPDAWKADQRNTGNGLLPFPDLVQRWRTQEKDSLAGGAAWFEQFRNALDA